jgi:hypothetical protein
VAHNATKLSPGQCLLSTRSPAPLPRSAADSLSCPAPADSPADALGPQCDVSIVRPSVRTMCVLGCAVLAVEVRRDPQEKPPKLCPENRPKPGRDKTVTPTWTEACCESYRLQAMLSLGSETVGGPRAYACMSLFRMVPGSFAPWHMAYEMAALWCA